MSEQRQADTAPLATGETVMTGVPETDAVLAEVEGLGDRPIDEHVGVFERAQQELRRSLDVDPADVG